MLKQAEPTGGKNQKPGAYRNARTGKLHIIPFQKIRKPAQKAQKNLPAACSAAYNYLRGIKMIPADE